VQPGEVVYFASPAELRAWFEANHETAPELWVGFWKKETGRPSPTWSEAVDEALCFGWIDGIRKRVDGESYTNRFTPRRKGSTWSAVNVKKVEALVGQGRVRPAGLKAFEARDPASTNLYSFEREHAALAPEQEAELRANPAAWAYWQSRPPSYRKAASHWVISAKQSETRARRLATLVADCAAGRTIGPLTRPV
jgi:uncharacterized protein YdeI (YjbR/CyaY-like superfamily)